MDINSHTEWQMVQSQISWLSWISSRQTANYGPVTYREWGRFQPDNETSIYSDHAESATQSAAG